MFTNNINFLTLILVIIIAIGFILFLLAQANLLNLSFYPNSTFDSEKYSPYECGFSPFRTERAQFDIKFYLVALLFLVFDVELMFLLPYCLSYYYLGILGYIIFLVFFFILIIGFLVEWAVGMLTWRGEEKNPISLQKNIFSEIEKKNKQTNYVKYIIQYLNYLDKFGYGLKYLEYFNILRFIQL
jgi:NADH-quinone oxidoreductase subunit A